MRIGVIGTGWVGSSVAISILHKGVARELLLAAARTEVAEGEAMALAHGASFYPSARVRAVDLEEMRSTDAIVISAGRGGKPGESRLDLLRDTAGIIRSIAEGFRGYEGLLVVVTNPVDVLTQIATEASGLPPSRVLGTGTLLDTSRLRQTLAVDLGLDPRSVHAQVVGEHGDSEVVLWSSADIGGCPLREWPGWDPTKEDAYATTVRRAAYEIIRRKGATNHAIGLVTANLLQWALRGERRVLTVSRVQEGAAGIDGVALSLPAVVGQAGAEWVITPHMDDGEREGLLRSAEVLRRAYADVRSG
ncbi:MAG: L-lactate dehydrogenase [Sandaracinaceae bacterium]